MKTEPKENECEFCDGTGDVQESCCGCGLNDMGICTGCGEHCAACGDKCEECNGTGVTEPIKPKCPHCGSEVDKEGYACERCCVRGTNTGHEFKLD